MMKMQLLTYSILLSTGPIIDAQMAQGQAKFLGNILSTAQEDHDFAAHWNQVTPENSGKWGSVERTRGKMNWSELDAMYKYARRHGFPFKEHTFIWGHQQPTWIASLPLDQQRQCVRRWISQYGRRYPDTELIDVVNEPIHYPPPYKEALGGDGSTGWDWVIWAFATARRHCPRSKLLLNEYGTLESKPDLERYIAIAKILKKRKLIDGIGVQAHGLENVSDATIRSNLNRLRTLRLPIYVSELDLGIADDNVQQKRYKSLFPIFWRNSGVAGVTLWGYKQNQIWNPRAYLLRADGSERPALIWLKDYTRRCRSARSVLSPVFGRQCRRRAISAVRCLSSRQSSQTPSADLVPSALSCSPSGSPELDGGTGHTSQALGRVKNVRR